jgi:TRAP-type transport system periplasmic protein
MSYFKSPLFCFCALFFATAFLLVGLDSNSHAENKHIIKFSTLAPEGSSWMKSLRRFSGKVKKATEGNVSFKFYPGGVSGDEIDVIRKMRIGQLHGAGFTGVGLGAVLPEVRVLDLPFLFQSDQEIEHVYQAMNEYFVERFEKKGYILLGWVPVGWIHFLSQKPIQTVADLRASKPWLWEGDPLVEQAYEGLDVQPIPLSITDVLLSLQTGMMDTVYSSTQGALVLQWFTKVKHITRLRMGYATGGVLISKRKFEKLPPAYQEALRKIGSECLTELATVIRKDNLKAEKVLENNGIKWVPQPDPAALKEFQQAGVTARQNLSGKLFSPKLLNRVLRHLDEVR